MIWALFRIGRTPRRHRFLLEWLLVALPGFVLSAALAARYANIHLDQGEAESVEVAVLGVDRVTNTRTTPRSRRFGGLTTHWLRFESRHPVLEKESRLRIDGSTYEKLHGYRVGGSRARLELHRGALGMPWVDEVQSGN